MGPDRPKRKFPPESIPLRPRYSHLNASGEVKYVTVIQNFLAVTRPSTSNFGAGTLLTNLITSHLMTNENTLNELDLF
jgi:hypothetical protein